MDLDDRASHPAGVFLGRPFSLFAKLGVAAQVAAELRGLSLIRSRSSVATPLPVGGGLIPLDDGALLVLEAVPEVPRAARSVAHWRSIGLALAGLHDVADVTFGLAAFDGFFGPLPQSNVLVPSAVWVDFYAERRLLPNLRAAVDAGTLPPSLARAVERLVGRQPLLCGPEPRPALLHGDAQQNNFLTTASSAYVIDPCPYFGHPEVDLALLDYFEPVPEAVFDGYRERRGIDPDFPERRELWRLFAYLAVIAVDGTSTFGRPFVDRLAAALTSYR
ncbi:fructosamine kinase family protein [Tenggerimyces flavus]|uniref:Fructosamine kinase family protein n=1 Tax=Tenggerimyces flavus TaxID=1708749 RepID=A0ABV7Y7G6_9ACTN|nr:fructosamine kinase family protein [Tenggerimyces flavus]MBM7785175.1 fructosamine-3-kinase [Tenggerimyces flavus]